MMKKLLIAIASTALTDYLDNRSMLADHSNHAQLGNTEMWK